MTVSVDAHGCEQLAQSRYTQSAPWPGIELESSRSQVRRRTIAPPRHRLVFQDFDILYETINKEVTLSNSYCFVTSIANHKAKPASSYFQLNK